MWHSILKCKTMYYEALLILWMHFPFLNTDVLFTLLYDPGCRKKYHLMLKWPVNLIVNLLLSEETSYPIDLDLEKFNVYVHIL